MEDGLVRALSIRHNNRWLVLILVVMEDGLVLCEDSTSLIINLMS